MNLRLKMFHSSRRLLLIARASHVTRLASYACNFAKKALKPSQCNSGPSDQGLNRFVNITPL